MMTMSAKEVRKDKGEENRATLNIARVAFINYTYLLIIAEDL